jgi:hypothetical protein
MPSVTIRLISRRQALLAIPSAAVGVASLTAFSQTKERITVYKDPNCGCCAKWVEHMEANGYLATVINADMKPIKARFKIPAALESCHTTIVRNFVIEGHVPAADIKRFVSTKHAGIVGLTIPGMPASAPGMDVKPFQPYDVLTFDQAGRTTVFAKHTK